MKKLAKRTSVRQVKDTSTASRPGPSGRVSRRSRNLAAAAALLSVTAAADAFAEEEVDPAQLYQAVAELAANVDLVREVMGRPELTTDPWIVVDAQPRHVVYQAMTLHRKANWLSSELVGAARAGLLPVLGDEIDLGTVLSVVQGAALQIDIVRGELGMTYAAEVPELEPDTTLGDVLREIVQVSRQLNFLPRPPVQVGRRLPPPRTLGHLRRGRANRRGVDAGIRRLATVRDRQNVRRRIPAGS